MVLRRFTRPLTLAAAFLFLIAGTALAAKTYPDRRGDVHGGAGPDISSVFISNTASLITFEVRFVSSPPLRANAAQKWVDMLLVGLDVPPLGPPPTTPGGEWPGVNYAAGLHGPSKSGQLVRLQKGRSTVVSRFRVVTTKRTVKFSISRRALGGPAWFAFSVAAARETETATTGGGFDVLPQRGTSRYVLN
jgi:hypothetical protein